MAKGIINTITKTMTRGIRGKKITPDKRRIRFGNISTRNKKSS